MTGQRYPKRRLTSNNILARSCLFLALLGYAISGIVTALRRAHGTLLPPVREHLP